MTTPTATGIEREPLTPRQAQLLRFLERFIREHGYAPSHEEMRAGLDVKGWSTVSGLLDQLEEKGYIKRFRDRRRNVVLLAGAPATTSASTAG